MPKFQPVRVRLEDLERSDDKTASRIWVGFPAYCPGRGLVRARLVEPGQDYLVEMGQHYKLRKGAPEPEPVETEWR